MTQQESIYIQAVERAKSRRAIDIKRAMELFESIPDYKDASNCAEACQKRLDQLAQYDAGTFVVRQKKPMITVLGAVACLLIMCIVVGMVVSAAFGEGAIRTNAGVSSLEPTTVPQETALPANSISPTANGMHKTTFGPVISTNTPTSTPKPTHTPSAVPSIASDVGVGSIVQYGSYEQDNVQSNGPEPIEWIVLDKQDDKALLISKYGLDAQAYHFEYNYVTWQSCSLRTWLNHQFYQEAFTFLQQQSIISAQLNTENYPNVGHDDESAIIDQVFLLSREEAEQYFADDEARKLLITSYARKKGAGTMYTDTASWWLRSSGSVNLRAANITLEGALGDSVVDYNSYAVRPAMWVTLDSGRES